MLYDLPLTPTVKTLSEPFAKPFAGRAARVLFINSVKFGREAAELMQRTDIEVYNVTYDRHWDLNKWGFGDFYDKRGNIGDPAIMLHNIEETLCSDTPFDVIVLPAINGYDELTPATREAILSRVCNGAGLVLIHPMVGGEPTGEALLCGLSPLLPREYKKPYSEEWYGAMHRKTWIPRSHSITAGIPFDRLPYDRLCCSPYTADGEVILETADGDPVAAIKAVGRGRVAAFAYYNRDFLPQHADYRGADGCFNPITDTWLGAMLPYSWDFMECFYRLMARTIWWCAGITTGAGIIAVESTARELTVRYHSGEDAALAVTFRNRYGEVVAEESTDLSTGQSVVTLAVPPVVAAEGGMHFADIRLANDKGICDFHLACIDLPERTSLSVDLKNGLCKNGEVVSADIRMSGNADRVEVGLVDGYGRLMAVAEWKAEPVMQVEFTVQDCLSGHVHIEAAALLSGSVTARARSADCVVTPASRKLDDFEVFLNPQNRGQGDLLPYVNRLFPMAGMTGNFIGDSRVTAMSGAHGLRVYWYNRKPYAENRERWFETGDKRYLHRKPCLNDPSFWEENEKQIRQNVAKQKRYGPIAYFAQDEGSLTCYTDEMDFCFCPHCMDELRRWLRAQYATLAALNESWGTKYESWEEPVPLTREEARRAGRWAPWADHRRFMEICYADAYRHMKDSIREQDPQGEVRMSGCQPSTAYTGNDYDLLHEHVRYFEAYPSGGQYEFHRSFKHPDTMLGGWFGYGVQGAQAKHSVWHAVFHGLTLMSIFWEYSILNPDFTFCSSAEDFGDVFRTIKHEGIGKLLLYAAKPDIDSIAVHYSMASVHGTNIAGQTTLFEENRDAWCSLLADCGVQFRFVSSRKIEEGGLSGFKLLILPYSIALSDKEVWAIEEFVQNGGIVLGDFQTGILDEHCNRRERAAGETVFPMGALDTLFGITRLSSKLGTHFLGHEYVPNPDFSWLNLEGLDQEDGPGVPRAEHGIRAAEGIRAYTDTFSGYGAALVAHPHGRGTGVYLNFSVQAYLHQRKQNARPNLRVLLEKILLAAGLEPPVNVSALNGDAVDGVACYSYALDGSEVIGILREAGSAEYKYDGLAKAGGTATGAQQRVRVRFRRRSHVYDIGAKQYLGFTDEALTSLAEGEAKLYSLLPYRAIQMRLAQEGEGLTACLEIDGPPPSRCVFAVNLTKPSGEHCALHSKNYIVQRDDSGRLCLTFSVPFALNDAGVWQVCVKDVLTGATARCKIECSATATALGRYLANTIP